MTGRLLRLELRRTAMAWLVPLLAALYWFTAFRPAMGQPPLWTLRGPALQEQALLGFAPVMAGVAAWAGSRDGRRRTVDLVTVTALPRWTARATAWAATASWAVAAYLACVMILYGITASQASWGSPLWWPVAVGVATVTAATAIGFAAGALRPGRLTTPAVAVVTFGALAVGVLAMNAGNPYAQISPLSMQDGTLMAGGGIFYTYPAGVPIAQVVFLAGLAAVAIGAMGLPGGAGGARLRAVAAAVTAVGVVAATVAVGLAGSARLAADGVVIPGLPGGAGATPVAYTPVCGREAVPVCVHPAYRSYLAAVTAALEPVLRQVTGLPGAPVRAAEAAPDFVPSGYGNGFGIGMTVPPVSGTPPVYHFVISQLPGTGGLSTAAFTGQFRRQAGQQLMTAVIGNRDAAQQAVGEALLEAAGAIPGAPGGLSQAQPVPGSARAAARLAVASAARRFLALPAATRHAWLASHLAALRAGRITLKEIP